MDANTNQCEALVLAVDETLSSIADALYRVAGDAETQERWPFKVVTGIGPALRSIQQYQPRATLVCTGLEHLDASSVLIDELRRRRPLIPVLAIADKHDETIERAVRIAGASYYFPLEAPSDAKLIHETLQSLGITTTITLGKVARSMKRSRASPLPARSRGQPRRSFM